MNVLVPLILAIVLVVSTVAAYRVVASAEKEEN